MSQKHVSVCIVSARLWYLIFAATVLLTFFRENTRHPFVGVDVSTFLGCARQIWLGDRPFLEVFDNNPPHMMYISMIPMSISNLCGITPSLASNLFTSATAAWSLLLSSIALRASDKKDVFVTGAMLSSAFVGMAYLGPQQFGQREHLFVML